MGHVRDLHAPRAKSSATPRRRSGLRWQACWTDPAGLKRAKVFPTRDEARSWVTRIEVSIRSGEYQLPTRMTVRSWTEQWLAQQESWRASTRVQQKSRLRSQILPAIGSLPLEQVTKRMERLADGMRESGLSAATRRAVLTLVVQLFAAAVDDGHLVKSPAAGVRAPSGGSAREIYEVMTLSQVAALIEQMPTPAHRLLAELIGGTGLRIGETRSLTADRLRLDTPASITVDRQLLGQATSPGSSIAFGPPKGGSAGRRSVAIPPTLAEQLREHVCASVGFVFESQQHFGRPMNPRSLGEVWQHAGGRAGIDTGQHRGWHSLRHHHASRLIAAGISVVAVQRRLGHSSAAITLSTYSHLWPTDEQTILNALDTP